MKIPNSNSVNIWRAKEKCCGSVHSTTSCCSRAFLSMKVLQIRKWEVGNVGHVDHWSHHLWFGHC